MICTECNTSNTELARFCNTCGRELQSENTQQASAPRQQTETDSAADALIGSTIGGKYRLESKLGAGGMGAVYRATRLIIGDEVAIKILHDGQNDQRAAERFRREAQAAARLKHPNAVNIYDFGVTDDGLQYLVMELVEGESSRRIIKQQGPLTPSAAAEIISQVCAALDEAHRHNIIHRDIKPDNIIVDVTANRLRVKVLDFGIAKLRDDTAGNLTQTGSVLGTPHYMSPEQCLGEELDSRSDIYSLGIVLYEMLAGVVPFNSPSSAAVVVQHVTQPPTPLRLVNTSISPAVDVVVLHALEKQREGRPKTAGSFADAISAAIAGRTEAASGDISKGDFGLAGIGSTRQTQPTVVLAKPITGASSNARSPSLAKSPKRTVLGYIAVALGALVLGGIVVFFLRFSPSDKLPNANQQAPTTAPLKITATGSSVRLPIQTNTYDAGNAIDGRRDTAWVEGVSGPGIGEWIRLDFDREVTLHRVIVQPGYFKSPQIWSENNRVASLAANFSDGSSRELAFTDLMEGQSIALGQLKTRWVRLVIKSVYYGTNPGPYNDTALSEVTVEWGSTAESSLPQSLAPVSATPTPVREPLNTPLLTSEVHQVLDGWSGAARSHDLDSQMTYYADTLDPYFKRRNVNKAEIQSDRAVAYRRYFKLDLQLSNISVVFDQAGTEATATFDKAFAFEGEKHFSGSVLTKLWLTKFGSRWLITGEKDQKVHYINN